MARVCHLSHVEVTFNFMAPLLLALVERGHDVTVACNLDADGAHLDHYLGSAPIARERVRVARRISVRAFTRDLIGLVGYLRKSRFDILHVHGPLPALQARLAARLAGVPCVVYHAHGFYFHEGMSRFTFTVTRLVERFWCRWFTDYLITLNTEDDRIAREESFLVDPGRIRYFPGVGVDTRRFAPPASREQMRAEVLSESGFGPDRRIVLFVGRLVAEKGVRELLRAFRAVRESHPTAVLMLLGETMASERDQVTAQWITDFVETNRLADDVVFLGRRYDVDRFLKAADVFVLPTYREGMPVSLMEAMACGVACVATRVRGCRDAVDDGVTGILVEARSDAALATAVGHLLGDPALGARLGQAAAGRARARFGVDEIVRGQVELYDEMVAHTVGR